jgi:hypothetical protein
VSTLLAGDDAGGAAKVSDSPREEYGENTIADLLKVYAEGPVAFPCQVSRGLIDAFV